MYYGGPKHEPFLSTRPNIYVQFVSTESRVDLLQIVAKGELCKVNLLLDLFQRNK